MPTIPSIKQTLVPLFAVEMPPSKVFVVLDNVVKSVTRDDLDTIDDTFYVSGYSDIYNLTIISKKGK